MSPVDRPPFSAAYDVLTAIRFPFALALRNVYLEHPAAITGIDLVLFDALGQRNDAVQGSVGVAEFVLLLGLLFVLGPNNQVVSRHLHVEVLGVETRGLGSDDDFILPIIDLETPSQPTSLSSVRAGQPFQSRSKFGPS